ncbi:flagellar protein FlgN [Gluconobacter morbifer]|uniref:Flagella synthesis protein FlgN n=1 Tax=Gluconobacter morbifer G707 TaxID=1088869 RepID=G6XF44_9PROT|nr:flagellar protein FlgN [Gluconobacter morbifer]EHH68802.1 hypothetical protein GMO_01090 [Gluconobacter morbifer G707]
MSLSLVSAIKRLIAVLKAENDALTAAQVPQALALLPEKQAAATALEKEVADATARQSVCGTRSADVQLPDKPAAPFLPYHHLLEQVTELGNRNGELLQRAITAQKRVIDLLTETPPTSLTQGYGQQGSYASPADRQVLFISKA